MKHIKITLQSTIAFSALAAVFVYAAATQVVTAQSNDKTRDASFAADADSAGGTATRLVPNIPTSRSKTSSSTGDWTGLYIGGYAGVGFVHGTANTSSVFSPTGYFATSSIPAIATAGRQRLTPTGFTGGGTVGYNYQTGNVVVGVEADFGALHGSKSQSTTATYPCCAPTTFTVTQSAKTNWLFTARPRFGLTAGKALFYVTGGLAVTDLNYQAIFTDTFATAKENGGIKSTRAGWTLGGGIEYDLGNKWSLKGEYLFADFRRSTVTSTNLTAFSPPIAFPSNTFTHSIYLRENSVRFGVNYRF